MSNIELKTLSGKITLMWQDVNFCLLLALVFLTINTGCNSSDRSETTQNSQSDRPVFCHGEADTCSAQCLSVAQMIGRAELGLDPDKDFEKLNTSSSLWAKLTKEAPAGWSIDSLPANDVIRDLAAGVTKPFMLVSAEGHVCTIIGAIEVDGKLMAQVMHGGEQIRLVPQEKLLATAFKEAWCFDKASDLVSVDVGKQGGIQIDGVIHNFGELETGKEYRRTFTVSNIGNERLILNKPISSCGCLTTGIDEASVEIAPGGSKAIDVTLKATGAPSLRQTVMLSLFEKANPKPRRLKIQLLGSQRGTSDVSPKWIDFGTIVAGESYSRLIRLSEASTDRFEIEATKARELPIELSLDTSTDLYGLATYRIRATLKVDETFSGQNEGVLTIHTTSRLNPVVTLPVAFKVMSQVRPDTPILTLGVLPIGKVREDVVKLISSAGNIIAISEDSVPDNCKLLFDRTTPDEVRVLTTPTTPGVVRGEIKLSAKLKTGDEVPVIIRFSGMAKNPE